MDVYEDNFSWAQKLGCSRSAISNRVKKVLTKGIVGFIWDDLSKSIYPTNEVAETRKNILLYKLKNSAKDPGIESVKGLYALKNERNKLNTKIKDVEERYEWQEFANRGKVQQLRRKKDISRALELKKNILQLKLYELKTDVQDLQQAKSICDHLMPPTDETVDQRMMEKCLELVGTLASGANKEEVWQNVLSIIGSIQIPTLWKLLLENRIAMNDSLIELESKETTISNSSTKIGVKSSLAKLYSQYIDVECRKHFHQANIVKLQEEVLNYIDAIESTCTERCPEISDWLPLSLEVNKLDAVKTSLQNEVKELKEHLFQNSSCAVDYTDLRDVCQMLSIETKACVQDLQKSLNLLKHARFFIDTARRDLLAQVQNLIPLQLECEKTDRLCTDLATELRIFYDDVDMEAFRKTVLRGSVKAFRHSVTCIGQAERSVRVSSDCKKSSYFPMIRAPVCHLLHCFKAFILKFKLQSKGSLEDTTPSLGKLTEFDFPGAKKKSDSFVKPLNVQSLQRSKAADLLHVAYSTCEKADEHVQATYRVLELWLNQAAQNAVMKSLDNLTVQGATLREWLQRYSMVTYVIQQTRKYPRDV